MSLKWPHVCCTLVALSAAFGLLVGAYTTPAGRIAPPPPDSRPALSQEDTDPTRERSGSDVDKGTPGAAEHLAREREAIERSVARWLIQAGDERVASSSPAALQALYEAKDRIRTALACGISCDAERREWLALGAKVAETLGDSRSADRYRREIEAATAASLGRKQLSGKDVLLESARLMRAGRSSQAHSMLAHLVRRQGASGSELPFAPLGEEEPESDYRLLVKAVETVREPGSRLSFLQEAYQDGRYREAASVSWLWLQLNTESDESEHVRFLLAMSLWRLGRRDEALDELRPLTRIPWSAELQSRAKAWVSRIERELQLPADELAVVEKYRIRKLREAREKRRLRKALSRLHQGNRQPD